jgi:signal transduction histidine kinase
MLEEFDAQRRLGLLRLIVPGLLVLCVAALPFAVEADYSASSYTSSLQLGVGLVGFTIAMWALRTKRVDVASYALFGGVTGVIVLLILYGGPISGAIDTSTIPEFALLALPIVLAGVLSGPRLVLGTMTFGVVFTVATILLTPQSPDLARVLARPGGLVLFTVPTSTQLAIGVLMLAATRGYRRLQRELGDTRVAYARERELDRLKDQFISSVNHELRTPIMALQGYIELARELGARGDFARQSQMLDRGSEATGHLAELVRSVLDIRRVENDAANLQLTTVAVRPVVLATVRLLDPRVAHGQQRDLRLEVPPGLIVVADEERLRQVLLNLLSNAVKYSEPGTTIEVQARKVSAAGSRGGHRSYQPGTVEISVRDYGLGIPPEQAVLLFQRFVRLERDIASPVTGTGLGLAISRAYVEAMGGRIWVRSSGVPGEGSTFTFTLPAAQPDSPASGATSTRKSARDTGRDTEREGEVQT